eukprot:CAMPEP_0172628012 /NCGR_PEP_ID=MMETSP1068-20121228/159352_1 /TAXON_ID=35684 /ORGANISM="Pseudopedinella elastica, Strain CCMP716" /LENGTH=54 /DNA_ID=CAMNT_0013438061 /DNA_START=82 /DNA_END=243 /DNA_ORIENTATION=-
MGQVFGGALPNEHESEIVESLRGSIQREPNRDLLDPLAAEFSLETPEEWKETLG